YIGDVTWVRGEVRDKVQRDGRNEVHIEVRCENRHGEATTPGTAVVLLPTRDRPRVELPEPPAPTLDGMLRHELDRYGVGS
ncbi:hypothetical protein, partial [Actinomadura sp. SCN-SB]|uniref:hypothetical protein n=1 Tax=Actinomadura sp. SCN-SB TaxID=3373092 RepID=UPI003751CE49